MAPEGYFDDELVPPKFIDEDFIVQMLQKADNDRKLYVINYDIRPGSTVGDHYMSIMFKICVTYASHGKIVKDRRLVLKTIPDAEGIKKQILEGMPVFANEISIYTKTLSAMETLLKEKGEKCWWPKLIFSQLKPFVLVLEDLTADNFGMVYNPLTFDQMPLILDKMAKYHALGIVLRDRGNTNVTGYKFDQSPGGKAMFLSMHPLFLKVGEAVKSWDGFQVIGEKIVNYSGEKLYNKFLALMENNFSSDFSVLNHGDFHLRNLMFKKNASGELIEVAFLDFQLPIFHVPIQDFCGFFHSMVNNEVRKREAEVIEMYHQILTETLEKYGYSKKMPTVADINQTLLQAVDYRVWYALTIGPYFRLQGIDFSGIVEGNKNEHTMSEFGKILKEPEFIEDMKSIVAMLDSVGAFE